MAFHKAEALGKAPKKISAAGPAPDLEEAFDVSNSLLVSVYDIDAQYKAGQVDDDVPEAEEEKEEVDDDPEHDSLIKPSKPKGKPGIKGKGTIATKGRGVRKS